MKIPYAVKRFKNKKEYMAWTPFDGHVYGRGFSKTEALADLKKQIQERITQCDGEIGETEI